MIRDPAIKAAEPVACPHCGATFGDANARYQHVRNKHGKKAARKVWPHAEREMSLADELIAAVDLWRDGGEPPDYLRTMFPEAFR